MRQQQFVQRTVVVENRRDTDLFIRDCHGREYVIYPRERRELEMIVPERGRSRNDEHK